MLRRVQLIRNPPSTLPLKVLARGPWNGARTNNGPAFLLTTVRILVPSMANFNPVVLVVTNRPPMQDRYIRLPIRASRLLPNVEIFRANPTILAHLLITPRHLRVASAPLPILFMLRPFRRGRRIPYVLLVTNVKRVSLTIMINRGFPSSTARNAVTQPHHPRPPPPHILQTQCMKT